MSREEEALADALLRPRDAAASVRVRETNNAPAPMEQSGDAGDTEV